MYIPRYLEEEVREVHRTFKVLYVGGPRQTGKTTMLRRLAEALGVRYVSLDDPSNRIEAQHNPSSFLAAHPPPLLIDEAQYAPQLFPYIKMRVDERVGDTGKKGQYWLTGSQQFSLMKNMQESLAGRVGILNLLGLSTAEIRREERRPTPFLPGRIGWTGKEMDSQSPETVFDRIYRGSFPELWEDHAPSLTTFYPAYIQTYLDRDVREIYGVEKIAEFHTFLSLCAARSGQLLNYTNLAREAGVSVHAAQEWIGILESTMVIRLLRPYYKNLAKRATKTPKLYMLDTGLLAYLTGWPSAEALARGAMAGPAFETFVVSEILKSRLFRANAPRMFFFRDRSGHEVDLIIEGEGGVIHPIEIKLGASIREEHIPGMTVLRETLPNVGHGAVICLTDHPYAIDRETDVLPVSAVA